MYRLPVTPGGLLTLLAGWPRRVAALGCLVMAVLGAIGTGSRTGPGTMGPVLVANRALEPGLILTAADLRTTSWPATAVPADALRQPEQAVGRRVATSLARGQPIQPGSLLDPAVAAALRLGRVTTTVTLADQHQAAILATGAHVDLYSVVEGGESTATSVGSSSPLARAVTVLAVLPGTATADAGGTGGLGLIIATDPVTADRLAAHLSTPLIATLVPP
jgi:pilus assembly protein CpaB